MIILQAYRIERNRDGQNFDLITGGNLLASLFEILIDQKARHEKKCSQTIN